MMADKWWEGVDDDEVDEDEKKLRTTEVPRPPPLLPLNASERLLPPSRLACGRPPRGRRTQYDAHRTCIVLLIDASARMTTSVQPDPDGPTTSGLHTAMHCAVMLYRNKCVATL